MSHKPALASGATRRITTPQPIAPVGGSLDFAAALGDVWSRWKNDYRYASDDRVLRDLRDRGLTAGIKGDPLKQSSRRVFEAAHELVGLGVGRWNSNV